MIIFGIFSPSHDYNINIINCTNLNFKNYVQKEGNNEIKEKQNP